MLKCNNTAVLGVETPIYFLNLAQYNNYLLYNRDTEIVMQVCQWQAKH